VELESTSVGRIDERMPLGMRISTSLHMQMTPIDSSRRILCYLNRLHRSRSERI
jgi:hypothetical protein